MVSTVVKGVSAEGIDCNPTNGNLVFTERTSYIVSKIPFSSNWANGALSTYAVSTLAGVYGSMGYGNGLGSYARFSALNQITYNPRSNMFYFVDSTNAVLQSISEGGMVTLVAGKPGNGSPNGYGSYAGFVNPYSIACETRTGNLFVGDNNYKIRLYEFSTGYVSTIAGSSLGNQDGLGVSSARVIFHISCQIIERVILCIFNQLPIILAGEGCWFRSYRQHCIFYG